MPEKPNKEYQFEIAPYKDPQRDYDFNGDTIRVAVEWGDPGGAAGEFEAFMRNCFTEWYDGPYVTAVPTQNQKPSGPKM